MSDGRSTDHRPRSPGVAPRWQGLRPGTPERINRGLTTPGIPRDGGTPGRSMIGTDNPEGPGQGIARDMKREPSPGGLPQVGRDLGRMHRAGRRTPSPCHRHPALRRVRFSQGHAPAPTERGNETVCPFQRRHTLFNFRGTGSVRASYAGHRHPISAAEERRRRPPYPRPSVGCSSVRMMPRSSARPFSRPTSE